jgi:hypothetical protein
MRAIAFFALCAASVDDHNLRVLRALKSSDEPALLEALAGRARALNGLLEAGDVRGALALARGAPRARDALSTAARTLLADEWASFTADEITTVRGTPLLGRVPPHCELNAARARARARPLPPQPLHLPRSPFQSFSSLYPTGAGCRCTL